MGRWSTKTASSLHENGILSLGHGYFQTKMPGDHRVPYKTGFRFTSLARPPIPFNTSLGFANRYGRQVFGFGYYRHFSAYPQTGLAIVRSSEVGIVMPHWAVALASIILPARWAQLHLRRRHVRRAQPRL